MNEAERRKLAIMAGVIERYKEAMTDVLKPLVSLMQDIDTIRSYMLKWTKEDAEIAKVAASSQQGGAHGTDKV